MNFNLKNWFLIMVSIAVGASACALNNEIVIVSEGGFQSGFSSKGFEFRFPPKQHTLMEPLHGASWNISGDITDLIREVVLDIFSTDFEGLASQKNSYMEIQDIRIVYQDFMSNGADSTLSLGLDLQFIGKYNGIYVDDCELGRIIPDRSAPLNHGLFATRDKMRVMIQPVYEDLIKEALTQALIVGLNCLSNKSESKLMN